MTINPLRVLCKGNPLPRYGASRRISEKAFQKLKMKQARMQCNDERPVYLKRGLPDVIVFGTITTVILLQACMNVRCIYQRDRGN